MRQVRVIDSVVLGPGRARRISDAPQGPDIKGGLRESGKVKAGDALLVHETEFGPSASRFAWIWVSRARGVPELVGLVSMSLSLAILSFGPPTARRYQRKTTSLASERLRRHFTKRPAVFNGKAAHVAKAATHRD